MPEKAQVIAELTAEDLKTLPVVMSLVAEQRAQVEQQVAELTATTTAQAQKIAELEADAAAKALLIAEFQTAQFDAQFDTEINTATDWTVTSDEGKAKLAALRSVIKQTALAQLGTVREMDAAKTTLSELMDGSLKLVVETMRDNLAGPSVILPARNNARNGDGASLLPQTDEERQQAINSFAFKGG